MFEQLDEHTRSLRDVISVVREVYRREAQLLVAAASDRGSRDDRGRGSGSGGSAPDLYAEELAYPSLREAVIAQEQVLLRATGFDTRADMPHKHLLNMAR